MNITDERQRARDRAADAIATRDEVRIGPNDWQPTPDRSAWMSEYERRRMHDAQRQRA